MFRNFHLFDAHLCAKLSMDLVKLNFGFKANLYNRDYWGNRIQVGGMVTVLGMTMYSKSDFRCWGGKRYNKRHISSWTIC